MIGVRVLGPYDVCLGVVAYALAVREASRLARACSMPRKGIKANRQLDTTHTSNEARSPGNRTSPHRQPNTAMSLENLLPLGKTRCFAVRLGQLTHGRTHRQVCRFANLGHYERRQRYAAHGTRVDTGSRVLEFTGKLVGFDDYVSELQACHFELLDVLI